MTSGNGHRTLVIQNAENSCRVSALGPLAPRIHPPRPVGLGLPVDEVLASRQPPTRYLRGLPPADGPRTAVIRAEAAECHRQPQSAAQRSGRWLPAVIVRQGLKPHRYAQRRTTGLNGVLKGRRRGVAGNAMVVVAERGSHLTWSHLGQNSAGTRHGAMLPKGLGP